MSNSEDIKNRVGVRVIKAESAGRVGSSQLVDPFKDLYETQGLIEPPFPLLDLAKLPESNNALQAFIDAYKTNIPGFGYSFRYTIDMESKEIDESIKKRAKEEWVFLENFYKYCNFDTSFTELMKQVIDNRERVGFGFLEVIPKGNGKPGGFELVPAHTIRMSKPHKDVQRIAASAVDIDGKKMTVTYAKKFRRFCQTNENDNTMVWFKEFGDPRRMSSKTGEYEVEKDEAGVEVRKEIPPEDEATSLIMFSIPSTYTPYGIPRWLGNLLSVQGSRSSEELNYNYFKKGKHVPMAIIVKNGLLTSSSIEKLEEYSTKISGVDNAHSYLIIEAEGYDSEGGFESNQQTNVDVKLQPLTQALQHDGLFQEYDKNNRDKIRASFRLPPIYTGESKDYTRATADTARSIAEEQIFEPDRCSLSDKINRVINQAFGIRYVELYFKGPNLTNKLELAQAVGVYNKTGALTPNMLMGAISELLHQDFEPILEDWGNTPLAITLAKLQAKAKEDEEDDTTGTEGTKKTSSTEPTYTDDTTKESDLD